MKKLTLTEVQTNELRRAHRSATINAPSTLKLFEALDKKHLNADSIFITLDNARYYKNQLVSKYWETSKIKLLFLPSYSPNLNLMERLWKFMRKTILYNQYDEKFNEFETAVMQFFDISRAIRLS